MRDPLQREDISKETTVITPTIIIQMFQDRVAAHHCMENSHKVTTTNQRNPIIVGLSTRVIAKPLFLVILSTGVHTVMHQTTVSIHAKRQRRQEMLDKPDNLAT